MVQSPEFPNTYPRSTEMVWRLVASANMRIQLTFDEKFGLEDPEDGICKWERSTKCTSSTMFSITRAESTQHVVLSDHVNTSTDCSDLCRLLSSCPGRPGRCNVPHYNTGNDDLINIPPLWRHSTVTFFILRGFYCELLLYK